MQNDFHARRILPKCFISVQMKISMEATTKEKFFKNVCHRISVMRIHFHYTL